MVLPQRELKELLTRNTVNAESLGLLWEVDSEKIYGLVVSGGEAIACWNYLRQLTDETGYYPLLLGGDDEVDFHRQFVDDYTKGLRGEGFPISINEIIERGSSLDSDGWLGDRAQQMYEEQCDEVLDDEPLEALTDSILGQWQDDVLPNHNFRILHDYLSRKPFKTVAIALIPTQICWHVPAYLKFGNWNDCPAPEEHVCLMKRWHERYGAEVVGITEDTVEMRVANPPLNRNDALALAKEQYFYCYDIVEQGTQTLSILAATLLQGSVWFFWWD